MTNLELDEIFKISSKISITEVNKNYIIIDNVYENVDKVVEFVNTLEGSLNGIEKDQIENGYSQERSRCSSIPLNDEYIKLKNYIIEMSKKYFNVSIGVRDNDYIFNTVINKTENKDQKLQHWPHKDKGPITNLIYLDKISDAGTMFYKDPVFTNENRLDLLNILERGNGYYRDVTLLEKLGLAEAKQNRMVILKGDILHGAYYNNHNSYLNEKRITQLIFTTN